MQEEDMAKLVADSLNYLIRQAWLPAIRNVGHGGNAVTVEDNFSDKRFEIVVREVA